MPAEGTVEEPRPETIEAARAGSLRAFEDLVRAYQHNVWRLAFNLVRDRGTADDVTQETFVRAFKGLPRYRGEAKFTTWLLTIARNCSLDEARRTSRRKEALQMLEAQPLPRSSSDASVVVEVRAALKQLPIELREALVLIDMLGESYADAAAVLGLPVGTVKSRVHRGREQMLRFMHKIPGAADEI